MPGRLLSCREIVGVVVEEDGVPSEERDDGLRDLVGEGEWQERREARDVLGGGPAYDGILREIPKRGSEAQLSE